MSLDESSVNGVGKGKLGEVLGNILLHLVLLETGSLSECGSRDDGGGVGFVSDGRKVLVGHDSDLQVSSAHPAYFTTHWRVTHLVVLFAVLHDLVGDGASLSERGDILADTSERKSQSLGHSSGKLSLGLVTDNGESSGFSGLSLLHVSRNLRVDTTAKTSVRGHGKVEDLALLGLLLGGGGLLE